MAIELSTEPGINVARAIMTSLLQDHPYIIVGVGGGSCSGKGHCITRKKEDLPADDFIMDWYYKDLAELVDLSTGQDHNDANHDEPDALHIREIAEHLQAIRRGEEVLTPRYSFHTHKRTGTELYKISKGRILIVDGLFALDPRLTENYHLSIFIDAPTGMRLARRVDRDTRERGRTEKGVRKKWMATVEAMYTQHIEPTRQYADLVIKNNVYRP
jgi:uridine kinase